MLFAIMILGIGFILIAAIFPVAIRQTAASGEETVASTIAKGAVADIQQVASNALMPTTAGQVWPIGPVVPSGAGSTETSATNSINLWNAIDGNMILPSDNRYAWAAMYERDSATTPYAQVIIVGMQVRNRTQYTSGDLTDIAPQPNLQPKQVTIQSFNPGNGTAPDSVTFTNDSASNYTAVATGCYLVISYDPASGDGTITSGPANANGYIYRIGNPVPSQANTWELMPGNDMQAYPANTAGRPLTTGGKILGLIVGESLHDPTKPYDPTPTDAGYNPFEGLAQDISVYVGFVRINS